MPKIQANPLTVETVPLQVSGEQNPRTARPYSSLGPSGPYPLLGGYFTKRVAAASVYASASHLNELSCLTYFRVVIVIAPVTPISRLECVSNCCGVLHHVARYSSLAKSLTNAPSERLFNMMVFW